MFDVTATIHPERYEFIVITDAMRAEMADHDAAYRFAHGAAWDGDHCRHMQDYHFHMATRESNFVRKVHG
jgi:hypothetical protein